MSSDVVDYAVHIAKRHYEEIGFIPKPRLEQYAAEGRLWHCEENGEPCGYLAWGNGWPVLRIYQVCIQYDAQRRHHGVALIGRLIKLATEKGYQAIACWVAEDIDANEFWRLCGFRLAGQRDTGNRRGRKHNQWCYWLPDPKQAALQFFD